MIDLLALIRSLPMKNISGIGPAVGFDTIYSTLRAQGIADKDRLKSKLEQLEKCGQIEVCRMTQPGFEEIIVAVRAL